MQEVFYTIAFRKKRYDSLEEIQKDIDHWINFYDNERPQSAIYCFGNPPMQTFMDNKELARNKDLNNLFRQNDDFILSDKTEAGSA